MENKMIKFKSEGPSISLYLYDVEGLAQPREFTIPANGKIPTPIPLNYAKYIFNLTGAMNLYSKGMLTIVEGEEDLMGQAKSEGIIETRPKVIGVEPIRRLLEGGELTSIRKALKDPLRKDIVMQVAQELGDKLTQGVLKLIEEETNISLTIEE